MTSRRYQRTAVNRPGLDGLQACVIAAAKGVAQRAIIGDELE